MIKLNRYLFVFTLITIFFIPVIVFSASKKPTTVSELALYKGVDRQQILEEGAKKEGKLILYSAHPMSTIRTITTSFQKKYPYIKVEIWRAGNRTLLPRVVEEYKSGSYAVDIIAFSQAGEMVLKEAGILQPFYSPELEHLEKDTIRKAPVSGVFFAGHWASGIGLGYNTDIITKDQLPKSYQDLLDPKWKGKLPIPASNTGVTWMGAILDTYGEDFVRKLAMQNFVVHMISGRALLDLVVAGECPLSPSIIDAEATYSKNKGASVDWIPLEPVQCYLGGMALPKHSNHPYAAMLYIDFDLSREAGELYKAAGYSSPRKDIINPLTYKKTFGPFDTKQLMRWTKLFDELFLKK